MLGSGLRVHGTRYVATAAHVMRSLQAAPEIRWESRRWPARGVRTDDEADLALPEIDADAPMPGGYALGFAVPVAALEAPLRQLPSGP